MQTQEIRGYIRGDRSDEGYGCDVGATAELVATRRER